MHFPKLKSGLILHPGTNHESFFYEDTAKHCILAEKILAPIRWDLSDAGASCRAVLQQTDGSPVAFVLSHVFQAWSESVVVFAPAAIYNGNRFPALRLPYSPRVPEHLVCGKDTPPYITDVPRLNCAGKRFAELPSKDSPGYEDMGSAFQLKSGDMAFPALGWWNPQSGEAHLICAKHPERASDWLWEVSESQDSTAAELRIRVPGVRRSPIYRFPRLDTASPDVPISSAVGDEFSIELSVESWSCESIEAFYDHVFSKREALRKNASGVPPTLPFSKAFELIEDHYHRDAWLEDVGVFATVCDPQAAMPFQTGWCGGMIATHALLKSEQTLTRQRTLRNLEVFFENALCPSGLFYGKYAHALGWCKDFATDSARPYLQEWTLVRRQADALYYLLLQIRQLEQNDETWSTPPAWDAALRACADSFVSIWEREGEWGQFIDQGAQTVAVGGSVSGGLLPAALMLASLRFNSSNYRQVAESSARMFAERFLAKGYTSGGPADACQNPDSESVAALVKSYATLYQATGNAEWLTHGRVAAALLATWVMPYDFQFPKDSEFGRHDIRTCGSVFANTQNKHSAPGICTHSGIELFHLYRATGDTRLMQLLCDIARFIPQCISRSDQVIHDKGGHPLPEGWINERVNTSDWDDNLGGVFCGSCWSEVSMLLSYAELPGVYAISDQRKVWCLDHIEAELSNGKLSLHNSTDYDCQVQVLIETTADQSQSIDPFSQYPYQTVLLPAKSTLVLKC